MRRAAAAIVVAALAVLVPAAPRFVRGVSAQREEPTSPRFSAPLTLLQINDVYSTQPVDGLGGLARVATIKSRIAAAGRTPVLVLAGDFLSPSVESAVFRGEQMVAALNAAGLDFATLGNHEFDFGDDMLIQRMGEAKWQWVVSNVIDTRTGKPIGDAAPYVIRSYGPLKVGFIGLCLTSSEISHTRLTHTQLLDPMETAGKILPELKRQGANIIIAITHLSFAEDRDLALRFPEIDVIIGGHEHYPITATENRTLISKAGSDAKFVARIDLNRRADGSVERFYELMPVTAAIADEPHTLAVVDSYEERFGKELDVVVGSTAVPLDADTIRLRGAETNLGNFFADAIRADVSADIAIMNSGSIRGDRVYPAGPLTRRTLLAMHPFGNIVCKVQVSGAVVLRALNSGVSKLPATAGQFPQVSGLTMRVDANAPVGDRVRDVRVAGQPLDPQKTYTVAISDYQLEGGDEYDMFKGQVVVIGPEDGPLLVTSLARFIVARGEISPAIEGRITITR